MQNLKVQDGETSCMSTLEYCNTNKWLKHELWCICRGGFQPKIELSDIRGKALSQTPAKRIAFTV